MTSPWIPKEWDKPMDKYLDAAGKAAAVSISGNAKSASKQQQRFSERLERDRREMAALTGREFLL